MNLTIKMHSLSSSIFTAKGLVNLNRNVKKAKVIAFEIDSPQTHKKPY